ncbi:hypothetical protein PsorP6_009208 [Peronosclerospora sorghi]|uniref:Uncharacterized protein n=1 Tax=Peronosclerospora sorghi TaxID=230839 RepID=A0ACC0VZT7_9STRA|nr:hypothetical protein PsorP6_009208 [Peronosclerospora sorghi]
MVHGKLAHALQSFVIVAQRGFTLEELIYTCAIDLLVSKGKHWQATRLFEQMLERGEKHPTVYCFGRATVAYAGANRYEHARACRHKIVAMKEPNPIPTKYNKMRQGLTYCKDLELAVEVFEYVHDLFEPSQIHENAYTTAIRVQGRLGNTQRAVDLFNECVESRSSMARARAHHDDALRDAVATLPGSTAVEWVNDHVALDVFESLFCALCESDDAVLAATLVLKYARLHGTEHLVEAKNLLQLYLDGTHGVSLNQMPPYFQQHTIEMLLFIYGKSRDFDALRGLFEKQVMAFPLERAHYEVVMDYCAQSRDELAGAVTS